MLGFNAVGTLALGQLPSAATPISITWLLPLSEPVRTPLRLTVGNNPFSAFNPQPFVSFGWYEGLSEPVRFKLSLSATNQQFYAFYPVPLVSFGWFESLSEPQRNKPINPAAYRPDMWMQMAPSPFVATGWFNWLTEPVRIKPGLRADLQQFETQDTRWIPLPSTLVEGWFNWLSEPKRFPSGIGASYQLAYTAHPRVLPTPNVTIVVNTTEINNDKAQIAINVVKSNPAVSARVSIIEIGSGNSATAVIEH